MHATQTQGGLCPDTHTSGPVGVPASLFESDAWLEAARETYAQDALDQDRIPTRDGFQPWYHRQLMHLFAHPGELPMWVRTVIAEADQPATRDGYVVTDAGLSALATTGTDAEAPGTVGQVLLGAARYLERYGWIQGAYYDATSPVFTPAACMVGAIGMVCYGGPVEAPAQMFDDPGYLDFEEAVLHLDRYLLVEDGTESYEFNDAKGRQVDDILRALRQAADRSPAELIDAHHAQQTDRRTCPACDGPLMQITDKHYWCPAEDATVTTDGGDA